MFFLPLNFRAPHFATTYTDSDSGISTTMRNVSFKLNFQLFLSGAFGNVSAMFCIVAIYCTIMGMEYIREFIQEKLMHELS